MSTGVVYLDVSEAIRAVRDAAFTPEDSGEDQTVHTIVGGGSIMLGADWTLDGAVDAIRTSIERGWVDHLVGHDLAVREAGGRVVYMDVHRPVGVL